MTTRRSFVKQVGGIAGAMSLTGFLTPVFAAELKKASEKIANLSPEEAASNEDFWSWVQESYSVSPNIINLNNGGVSPQPIVVQNALEKYTKMCNEGPSYYMWKILDQGREPLRMKLADLSGCSSEEIAINRNSTEALNTVIFGLNLKAGDEVVLTNHDYPSMVNAWKQREKRDGIKLNFITLELPSENEADIVKRFENAFTPKTKVVHITHMINLNGQILPAKAIAKVAHERGIEVLVDGAHTFAHMDYKIPDLDCDYYGTSLHKWLCAPFGSGMLYIKKEKIKNIWPLLSNEKPESEDIRKFETLGTRSFPSEMAIGYAINFHNIIGARRKEERLRYLKNYWVEKVMNIPRVKLNTSLNPHFSCALFNFSIEGLKPAEIETKLFDKYKITTVAIDREDVKGVRVTPQVYTTIKDLDRLVKAIEEIAASATITPTPEPTKKK